MGKKVRPLRSQSIRYGAPVAQPAENDAKTVTKDNPAWVRLGDGRVRKVDAQGILSIKAGDARPEGRVARYGVFTERTGMLHGPRSRQSGNPESYLHADLATDGNVLVRKAGEVVSAMFPGRRAYPRIPSPNPHLGPATYGLAQIPQRPSNDGMAGANTPMLANHEEREMGRERGRKGWVTLGDGRKVYVGEGWRSTPATPAAKISQEDWARGVVAIAELGRGSRAPWLTGIERAERQARKILNPRRRKSVVRAEGQPEQVVGVPISTRVIRRVGNKWVLFTADGKRRLGTHESKRDAYRQEAAIEASKRSRKGAEPERATGVAMRQVGAGAERLAPLHGKEKLPAHLRPYDPGHRVAGRANRIAVARQMFRERGPYRPGAKMIGVGIPADDHVPGRVDRPLKKIVGASAWPYGINPYGMVPMMAPGLEWIPVKQGRRPARIDYPTADELPNLRTERGREAMSEMAKNPTATRDPDPWRAPSAKPRDPSPASKVDLRDPVPENGDPGLRAHTEGAGRMPSVRVPKGDDTHNVLLGAGRPMGRTVAPESHGREMPAHDRVSVDPSDYRVKPRRPEPARRPDAPDMWSAGREGGISEEDGSR